MIQSYGGLRSLLKRRLAEPAPGQIQLVTGPRQMGKTTLLIEIAKELGPRAIYAAVDGPEASLPGFWERLWSRTAEAARDGTAVLLLDEVQHLGNWSVRLKGEWDRVRRRKLAVHVVATGSSALRTGAGSKESLAGRFERTTISHWSAASLTEVFGLPRGKSAEIVVRRGAYPGAMDFTDDAGRWTSYVRESIVEPAIGRDLLGLGVVRRPPLLRQVFASCVTMPAQIVSLQKLQGSLQDPGALETIAHYLALLEEAYLVAPVQKHAAKPLRKRSAPPKIVVLSNALMAATDPRGIPDAGAEPARFGAWVENACLAHAWNAGQRVAYWRQEPLEIDAVIEGSWGRWAIEVKTAPFTSRDLRGLLEFVRRYPSYRPLVLCAERAPAQAAEAGVEAMRWSDFLYDGPPSAR